MDIYKVNDSNRKRTNVVRFYISDDELDILKMLADTSGMTMQDYLLANMLKKPVMINGNPRVFKALKKELNLISNELEDIVNKNMVNNILLQKIDYLTKLIDKLSS